MIFLPKLPMELAKDSNIAMRMELLYSSYNLIDIGTGAQFNFWVVNKNILCNFSEHVSTFSPCWPIIWGSHISTLTGTLTSKKTTDLQQKSRIWKITSSKESNCSSSNAIRKSDVIEQLKNWKSQIKLEILWHSLSAETSVKNCSIGWCIWT